MMKALLLVSAALASALVTRSDAADAVSPTLPGASLVLPQIHVGEDLTWIGSTHIRDLVTPTSTQAEPSFTHVDTVACVVEKGNAREFTVSRSLTVVLQGNTVSPSSTDKPTHVGEPKVVMRSGREFLADGTPLLSDPLCKFYSSALFGVPPATLYVGESWHFQRPPSLGTAPSVAGSAHDRNFGVTTSVARLGANGSIKLHVEVAPPSDPRPWEIVDLTVIRGGIISEERDQRAIIYSSTSPGARAQPAAVGLWRLSSDHIR